MDYVKYCLLKMRVSAPLFVGLHYIWRLKYSEENGMAWQWTGGVLGLHPVFRVVTVDCGAVDHERWGSPVQFEEASRGACKL
jgi:hypothetical protein